MENETFYGDGLRGVLHGTTVVYDFSSLVCILIVSGTIKVRDQICHLTSQTQPERSHRRRELKK